MEDEVRRGEKEAWRGYDKDRDCSEYDTSGVSTASAAFYSQRAEARKIIN